MCLRLLMAHVELIGRMKQQPELLDVRVHSCLSCLRRTRRLRRRRCAWRALPWRRNWPCLSTAWVCWWSAVSIRSRLCRCSLIPGVSFAVLLSRVCFPWPAFRRYPFSLWLCTADVRSAAARAAVPNSPWAVHSGQTRTFSLRFISRFRITHDASLSLFFRLLN